MNIPANETIEKYLDPYQQVDIACSPAGGFIVWRKGTGLNVELLHLKVTTEREGEGQALFLQMLRRLQAKPPYESIFGFTRVSNTAAQSFYLKMGFVLQTVLGVYADGEAILFTETYDRLKQKWRKEMSR